MLRALTLAGAVTAAIGACGNPASHEPRAAATVNGFFSNGDVRLSYQLDLPARTAIVPAIAFGHGSGKLDKTSCRFLADGFLQRGFATLCFDKRGVGLSGGEYVNVGTPDSERVFADLAGDIAAGVRVLRGHAEIDGSRIGLAGASQAGWIVPLAAAMARPAFMILLVGPTVSVGEEMFYSRLVEFNDAPLDEAYRQLPSFSGPRGFDPRPVLATLDVPGLWVLGAQDRSIPTPKTVAILDQLIAEGPPFARVVLPGAGHSLRSSALWPEIDAWLRRIGQRSAG
jgi:pimeloyl-ACP methyl ester carboxylesterase